MKIKVDFHTHSHHSLDARYTPEELARTAKARGLDAIAICDHNAWGIFDEDLRCADVLILKGVEYSTDLGHILGLFMREPPEIPRDGHYFDAAAVVTGIHAAGGVAVAAHPFPLGGDAEKGKQKIALCDGVEVFNARTMASREKSLPDAFAASAGKFRTAGSDSHTLKELGSTYIALEVEALTEEAIRHALLSGASEIVGHPGPMAEKARSNYKKAKTLPQKVKGRLKIALYLFVDLFRRRRMRRAYRIVTEKAE